jgi:hypothetical protein
VVRTSGLHLFFFQELLERCGVLKLSQAAERNAGEHPRDLKIRIWPLQVLVKSFNQ